MEWVAEGLTLCFLGILVVVVTVWGGSECFISVVVYRSCAVMLVIMAILSLLPALKLPPCPTRYVLPCL